MLGQHLRRSRRGRGRREVHAFGAQVGKYNIVRELGKGASAKVYLADDSFAKRKVAIKVAYPEALKNSDEGKRMSKSALQQKNQENLAAIGKIEEFKAGELSEVSFRSVKTRTPLPSKSRTERA